MFGADNDYGVRFSRHKEKSLRRSIGSAFVGCALLFPWISPMLALAQTVQPGKYTGNAFFVFVDKPMSHMVTLTVDKFVEDRVQGVAWAGGAFCRVGTPVRGRIKGDVLKLRGAPVKEGCAIN